MSFTELLNKGLATDVALATWCPTMDLLAVVAVNNNLSVHRLNWQYLWTQRNQRPVTAMCWKADGKMLAVGYQVSQSTTRTFCVTCISKNHALLRPC